MLQQRLESGTFLPFNDQAPLYNTITWEVFGPNFEGSPQNPSIWNDDATLENGLETTIPVFACPSPGHPTNVNRESIDKRVPSNYGGVQSGAFGNPIVTTPNKRSIGHKSHMDDSLGSTTSLATVAVMIGFTASVCLCKSCEWEA